MHRHCHLLLLQFRALAVNTGVGGLLPDLYLMERRDVLGLLTGIIKIIKTIRIFHHGQDILSPSFIQEVSRTVMMENSSAHSRHPAWEFTVQTLKVWQSYYKHLNMRSSN